ncbi:LacI family DNA-binding transcriptional regulator [Lacrimispora sp. 38-1]|uniref:LacI family DNA-binding transcriptional regulator n=1 Tax=Lacrimispora sp. 38-1 TaxID=3125778 RepID=UPI003CEFC106
MSNIKDVAKYAGVSLATASRVMRGENNVSPKKKKLVEDAAKALNYKPNSIARQLRKQETRNVIVIIPNIQNTFFHEIIAGIEKVAFQNDYQVLIVDMQNNPQIEESYFHSLMQRQTDGIISLSANIGLRLMKEVSENYPVVIAVQNISNIIELPSVSIDNVAASKEIMQHLIDLGHRNIGHLTCQPTLTLYRDRFTGYCQALAENGIPINMNFVKYGNSTIQSGYEQMCELVDQDEHIDAVFAAGDIIAIGAMKALADHGIRVPQDCAVVGFDDIELASFYNPALTTIRQPQHQIGAIAMNILCELMAGNQIEDKHVVLDHELVIRKSCGYSLKLQKQFPAEE